MFLNLVERNLRPDKIVSQSVVCHDFDHAVYVLSLVSRFGKVFYRLVNLYIIAHYKIVYLDCVSALQITPKKFDFAIARMLM